MLQVVSYFHQKFIKTHFTSVKNVILKKLIFINKKKIQKTRRLYFVLTLTVEVINYVEPVLVLFLFLALFLYGGIWIMQAGWYTSRLRSWFIVFCRGTKTCCVRSREDVPIRSRSDLQARMHHYRVSKCVLLHG